MKRAAVSGPSAGGPLTVEQMVADPVSRVALENWGEKRKPLSLDVVSRLFGDVLEGSDVHRVALLEASKYLEE
jgi:hypothetical protein